MCDFQKKLRSEEIKREDIRPEMELYILKDKFYLRLIFSHARHGPGITGPKATGLMTLLLGGSGTTFLAPVPIESVYALVWEEEEQPNAPSMAQE